MTYKKHEIIASVIETRKYSLDEYGNPHLLKPNSELKIDEYIVLDDGMEVQRDFQSIEEAKKFIDTLTR